MFNLEPPLRHPPFYCTTKMVTNVIKRKLVFKLIFKFVFRAEINEPYDIGWRKSVSMNLLTVDSESESHSVDEPFDGKVKVSASIFEPFDLFHPQLWGEHSVHILSLFEERRTQRLPG